MVCCMCVLEAATAVPRWASSPEWKMAVSSCFLAFASGLCAGADGAATSVASTMKATSVMIVLTRGSLLYRDHDYHHRGVYRTFRGGGAARKRRSPRSPGVFARSRITVVLLCGEPTL